MSDRETLIAMLDRAGVVWTADSLGGDDPQTIYVTAKAGPNNSGYTGFVTEFKFDEAGALKAIGSWE